MPSCFSSSLQPPPFLPESGVLPVSLGALTGLAGKHQGKPCFLPSGVCPWVGWQLVPLNVTLLKTMSWDQVPAWEPL